MAGIADVAKNAGVDPENVKAVLGSIKSIAQRENVTIQGIGTFRVVTRAARTAHNPRNPDEKILVPAKTVLTFKPAKPKK